MLIYASKNTVPNYTCIAGTVEIQIFDSLKMPLEIKEVLSADEDSINEFIDVCANSIDYGYGIMEVESKCKNDFSKDVFKSTDKHLRSTISLLNQK